VLVVLVASYNLRLLALVLDQEFSALTVVGGGWIGIDPLVLRLMGILARILLVLKLRHLVSERVIEFHLS
jgi:hypothetical protein